MAHFDCFQFCLYSDIPFCSTCDSIGCFICLLLSFALNRRRRRRCRQPMFFFIFYFHFGCYKIEFKIQIHSMLVNPNVIEPRSLFVW